jgi:hypothetical protein
MFVLSKQPWKCSEWDCGKTASAADEMRGAGETKLDYASGLFRDLRRGRLTKTWRKEKGQGHQGDVPLRSASFATTSFPRLLSPDVSFQLEAMTG